MPLQVTIDTPCHENWQHMQPNKDGRHCMSCQKTVVDFSLMNDKEILDFISHSNGDLCGRFDPHQLNRDLRETSTRRKLSWVYIWNVLIVGLLWTTKAKAQVGVVVKTERTETYPRLVGKINPLAIPSVNGVSGKVVNEVTGEPVPFASIKVERGAGHSTIADSSGNFILEKKRGAASKKLTVSAIGFASQTILVDKSYNGAITVYLSPEAEVLGAVEVAAFGSKTKNTNTECASIMLGAISTVVRVNKTEKITRVVKEWFPKKDVVTYPNPLTPGNTMNVALQLKETGQYRLELIDAAGKLLWMQSMNIPANKYNLTINTQTTWSAGVYWLRISGRHTKNVYNSRVVLQ